MIKKIIGCASLCILLASLSLSAEAFDNYDQNVVRAFKKLKIQRIQTDLPINISASENENNFELINLLKNNKKLVKSLKNKSGIFLISKDITDSIVKDVYFVKNPEQFMFTLDKNIDKDILVDRNAIKDYLKENISSYTIVSEKINSNNRSTLQKICSKTYNGTLILLIVAPKFGLGYVVNPIFYKMRTTTAVDIDSNISKEIENLTIGEKQFLDVKVIGLNEAS